MLAKILNKSLGSNRKRKWIEILIRNTRSKRHGSYIILEYIHVCVTICSILRYPLLVRELRPASDPRALRLDGFSRPSMCGSE